MPEFDLPKYQKKIKIKTEKYIANDKDVKEALAESGAVIRGASGEVISASEAYKSILSIYPQNKEAKQGLADLSKTDNAEQKN